MLKILLRIASVFLMLHGAATFAAAKILPLSAIGDRLLFAQHGFTFIFLALLNLIIWQSASSGVLSRWTMHTCNLSFLLLYVAISIRNAELPNLISTTLIAALFLIGLTLDRTARPHAVAPAT